MVGVGGAMRDDVKHRHSTPLHSTPRPSPAQPQRGTPATAAYLHRSDSHDPAIIMPSFRQRPYNPQEHQAENQNEGFSHIGHFPELQQSKHTSRKWEPAGFRHHRPVYQPVNVSHTHRVVDLRPLASYSIHRSNGQPASSLTQSVASVTNHGRTMDEA